MPVLPTYRESQVLLRLMRHLPSDRGRSSLRYVRRAGIPQPLTKAVAQFVMVSSHYRPQADAHHERAAVGVLWAHAGFVRCAWASARAFDSPAAFESGADAPFCHASK